MNKLYLPEYNIHWTLLGGQSHNWSYIDGFYYGTLTDRLVKVKYKNDILYWQPYPKNDDLDFLSNYFNIDVDYPAILNKISKDDHIKKSINSYPNLRILKQDFEETLFSYIFSSNKNIPGIRKSIGKFREFYGKKIEIDNMEFHLFPKLENVIDADEKRLRETGMGFRAKYLLSAIDHIVQNNLTNIIKGLSENDARAELMKIHGIGDKIADCILIYGLGFDNVTPLDVWGKRIVVELYKQNEKDKYDVHRKWLSHYFEGFAGWAGQFLYEYIRHNYK